MLFNSYTFLLFFPVVTILFFILPHRFRWLHLLLSSTFFYAAYLPVYLLVLGITILVDYVAGIYIEKSEGKVRKLYLIVSIVANIGFLCFFKYYDFFATYINHVLSLHIPLLNQLWISSKIIVANNIINNDVNEVLNTNLDIINDLVLPIGLSFHTFQALSYTIEVYKRRQQAERHLGIYALYVMFYPQLVAGPIERPQNIIPQLHSKKYFSSENLISGLRLMMWGLFKKVVIADRLSVYVDIVFHKPESYHWLNVLIAVVFFAIQIYCDFSGYTDMAIGAAKTMGYDLMQNFSRPYFATNIKKFWERWHISLTTWFRDYVYISLGGNRVKLARYIFNILVVFLLSGLWHGANLTFIVWGALHACYYIAYIIFKRAVRNINTETLLWNVFSWVLTFGAVCFAWIFFRAKSIPQAIKVIRSLMLRSTPNEFSFSLRLNALNLNFGNNSLVIVLLSIAYMLWIEKKHTSGLTEFNKQPIKDFFFLLVTIVVIIVFGLFVREQFIYFQF